MFLAGIIKKILADVFGTDRDGGEEAENVLADVFGRSIEEACGSSCWLNSSSNS
jgi:hypothetical protein